MFCFMASAKQEPVVTLVVLDETKGKLVDLNLELVEQMQTAMEQFKIRFQFSGELFAYTSRKERIAVVPSNHSRHFHLRIRIPTELYLKCFPPMQIMGCNKKLLQTLIEKWEPLHYNFRRQVFNQWHEERKKIYEDILVNENGGLNEKMRMAVQAMRRAHNV